MIKCQRCLLRLLAVSLLLWAMYVPDSLVACTLWSAAGNQVAGGGILIAKNRDQTTASGTLKIVSPTGQWNRYLAVLYDSFPSMGINEKGLVLISATAPDRGESSGASVNGLILSSYSSVAEVLSNLSSFSGYHPQFFIVADGSQVARIEIAPDTEMINAVASATSNGVLAQTNHYLEQSFLHLNYDTSGNLVYGKQGTSSGDRYARITALLGGQLPGHTSPFDLNDFVAFSRDHTMGDNNSIYRTACINDASQECTLATFIASIPQAGSPAVYVKMNNQYSGGKEHSCSFVVNDAFWTKWSGKDNITCQYSISGRAKDLSTGKGISDAVITIQDASGMVSTTTATTDGSGNYVAEISSAGEYIVSATKVGYVDYTQLDPPVALTDASPSAVSMIYMDPSGGDTTSLKPGWNFISFLRLPSNPSPVERVLKDISPNVRIVWGYDNINKVWLKYAPNSQLQTPNSLDKIEFGKGYWIYMDAPGTVNLNLWQAPSATHIRLFTGWDLVGYYGTDGTAVNTALSGIAGMWSILWSWDNGQWYGKHAKISVLPDSIQPLTSMNHGKAYWVRMNKPEKMVDDNYKLGTQQVNGVTSQGQALASMLDGMGVATAWLKTADCSPNCYLVNWQTGETSGNTSPQPDCTTNALMKTEEGLTFCSSFVSAVVWKASNTLGTQTIPFLHPFNGDTAKFGTSGQCAPRSYLSDYQQDWLNGKITVSSQMDSKWNYSPVPSNDGWYAVPGNSMVSAQNYANQGYLVVASYKYPLFDQNKKPGHITILYPMQIDSDTISAAGPEVVSAGWDNSPNPTTLKDAFKHHSCYYANNSCQGGTTCPCNDQSGKPVGGCDYCLTDTNGNPVGAWESMQRENPYILFFYRAAE